MMPGDRVMESEKKKPQQQASKQIFLFWGQVSVKECGVAKHPTFF